MNVNALETIRSVFYKPIVHFGRTRNEFDIALIGCGAYGMSLGAHVKRQGKLAIHMAGWLQMLFGIYGNRWVRDQPQYAKYINEHWIRPSKAETPAAASQVESGCYW